MPQKSEIVYQIAIPNPEETNPLTLEDQKELEKMTAIIRKGIAATTKGIPSSMTLGAEDNIVFDQITNPSTKQGKPLTPKQEIRVFRATIKKNST